MSVVVDSEKKDRACFDCQITVIGTSKDSGLYHS